MRLIQKLFAAAALLPCLVMAQTPIKVGIANDLSGPFAALGAEARDGFNLAIKQLGGKLGGQPAEFLQADMAAIRIRHASWSAGLFSGTKLIFSRGRLVRT